MSRRAVGTFLDGFFGGQTADRRVRCRPALVARASTVVAIALHLAVSGALAAESRGTDPASWPDAHKEEFLRTAEIVSRETLPTGVTVSSRATLSDGLVTHDAHIQSFDFYRKKYKTRGRTFLNFVDSYRYNIAAYRLDRLLDLGMVPVSVERSIDGERAAVTWWIDNAMMTLRERYSRGLSPPDVTIWNDQRHQGRIFNQLIYNADAHLGNHVLSTDWKLWMVDFTRAFRTFRALYDVDSLGKIDRRLYDSLGRLSAASLESATEPYLTGRERKAILARRDRLLEHFDARIAAEGVEAVICDLPRH